MFLVNDFKYLVLNLNILQFRNEENTELLNNDEIVDLYSVIDIYYFDTIAIRITNV